MKFKQLINKIQKLNENAGEHTEGGGLFIGDPQKPTGPSVLTNKGTHNIKLPRSLDVINALLQAFSSRDYVDPDEVVGILRQKLNHFGFDFEGKTLQDGENVFTLVQYGSPQLGVYGQNPYDDVNKTGFKQGDGIKEKLGHSLDMVVSVTKGPNMLRKLNIMIVPGAGNSELNGESNCGCMHKE